MKSAIWGIFVFWVKCVELFQSAIVSYGIGGDGTVGGTKQVASIIGNSASAIRPGSRVVTPCRNCASAYGIQDADYVGCHRNTYVNRFRLLDNAKIPPPMARPQKLPRAVPWRNIRPTASEHPKKISDAC